MYGLSKEKTMKKKTLKFVCKKCGHEVIEQVLTGCTVVTKIAAVQSNEVKYEDVPDETTSSEPTMFQCALCGEQIPAETDEDLIDWLKDQQVVEKTKVSFRVSSGEIVAVFPDDKTDSGKMCCYAHVGQHSYCNWGWYRGTKPATPEQYADLKAELKKIGYALKVVKRIQRSK
jgi:hypothetical protein